MKTIYKRWKVLILNFKNKQLLDIYLDYVIGRMFDEIGGEKEKLKTENCKFTNRFFFLL